MMDLQAASRRPTPIRRCCGSMPASTATRSRCARRISASGARSPGTTTRPACAISRSASSNLGLARGDVIGIIGDNRPDWVAAEIAAHAIGGLSLGLYRDVLDEEAAYLLNYGEAQLVFAEDEEQVDKLLALADRVPHLQHIVYSDPRGMRKYDDPRLMSAENLAELGRARAAREPELYDNLVDATEGRGRRDPLHDLRHHRRIQNSRCSPPAACSAIAPTYLAFDPKGPDDEYVSVLPLPWIMEQVYVLGKGLLCRMKINFVEEPDTMMNDLREIAPTFVLFAPRVWESIAADVRAKVMDATPFKQRLFDVGMKSGLAALEQGKRSSLPTRSCSARCATGSASPGCARPPPAAQRSGPIPSSSSRRWACRCARSTARPSCWAPTRCIPRARSILTPRACRWPTASRSASTTPTSMASARSWCGTPTCSSAITRTRKRASPTSATAGCCRAMPAISTRTASLSSSTASRISPRPRAASASRRNSSRTS